MLPPRTMLTTRRAFLGSGATALALLPFLGTGNTHLGGEYASTVRKGILWLKSIQKANGVTAEAVYQATDNPNDVTVTHEFATLEAAQAFTRLEELRKAMQSGGVVGTPTVWFTQKV